MDRSPPLRVYQIQLIAHLGLVLTSPNTSKTFKLAEFSNSQTHYAKGTQPPLNGYYTLLAHGFRIYFTVLTALLFTFPSRYLFTIGRYVVFSLTGWSPLLHAKLHVCCVTQVTAKLHFNFDYGAITLYNSFFQMTDLLKGNYITDLQPW